MRNELLKLQKNDSNYEHHPLPIVMLDASGLYFLYKTSEQHLDKPESDNATTEEPSSNQISLSVTLGVGDTLRQAMTLINSGQIRPNIPNLSDSLDVHQHRAQTILHCLSAAGHLQKQGRGKGYAVSDQQGELL